MSSREKFIQLLDPDEPSCFCEFLKKIIEGRLDDEATAKTITEIVLEPLDWFEQQANNHGKITQAVQLGQEFRLAADELRYRFSNAGIVVIEQIEALKEKWIAFQASAGWSSHVLLQRATPLAKVGLQFKHNQRQKAKQTRSRIKFDGDEFSIKSIVDTLAARADALGDPLPTSDLWPELFSELDARNMEPEEKTDRIEYIKNDKGERDSIKKTSFVVMVSRARNRKVLT